MSEQHDPPLRPLADRVLEVVDAHIDVLRRRVQAQAGDDVAAVRDELLKVGFEAQGLRRRIQEVFDDVGVTPAPAVLPEVPVPSVRPAAPVWQGPRHAGEDTRAWLKGKGLVPMRRNRGPR